MRTFDQSIYDEIGQIDLPDGLEGRILHVTGRGVEWYPVVDPCLTRKQLLDLYYYMTLTRSVDNRLYILKTLSKAFGKHPWSLGNEATSVGAAYALQTTQEWIAPTHRSLGVFLVRGVSSARLFAQACARTNGLTGGWDSSLHMGSRRDHIAGFVSHLGTLTAIGAGCAFAEKYRDTGRAVLVFTGDGATSTGDFHEALNIAAVLRLPLVVVIENNQWAFGTPTDLQYAVPTLALRSLAYGPNVEGYWLDGTNVLGVYQTVLKAMDRARTENTISIIECVSMRLKGHTEADDYKSYVPVEQLAMWEKKDPVIAFRKKLLHMDPALSGELEEIDRGVADEVKTGSLEGESGPVPDPGNLENRVFFSAAVPQADREPSHENGEQMTYGSAICAAMMEEMERDPNIFLIGEDIGLSNGAFKITKGLSRKFDGVNWQEGWKSREPFVQKRVIDAPLAEAGFTGLALGAALNGLRPVVEFQFADFASEAFKMIVNYAATQAVRNLGPVPIVFRMPSGWAHNTSIYHSVNPESWFASTPGLKIVAPITAFDAKGLLKSAVRDDNPVLFLEYKHCYNLKSRSGATAGENTLPIELDLPVPAGDYTIPFGKARVVKQGEDISLVSYGSQVLRAVRAANELEALDPGISVEVIDLRTLIPYDFQSVNESVKKTSRAVVTCEAPRTGCFGNTLVTNIMRDCFNYLAAPITLVAAADTPVPFAPTLEEAHLPTSGKLVIAMRELLRY